VKSVNDYQVAMLLRSAEVVQRYGVAVVDLVNNSI
jgi:hypothetical protein